MTEEFLLFFDCGMPARSNELIYIGALGRLKGKLDSREQKTKKKLGSFRSEPAASS